MSLIKASDSAQVLFVGWETAFLSGPWGCRRVLCSASDQIDFPSEMDFPSQGSRAWPLFVCVPSMALITR